MRSQVHCLAKHLVHARRVNMCNVPGSLWQKLDLAEAMLRCLRAQTTRQGLTV